MACVQGGGRARAQSLLADALRGLAGQERGLLTAGLVVG